MPVSGRSHFYSGHISIAVLLSKMTSTGIINILYTLLFDPPHLKCSIL